MIELRTINENNYTDCLNILKPALQMKILWILWRILWQKHGFIIKTPSHLQFMLMKQ